MKLKHGWNQFDNCINIHENVLANKKYSAHFQNSPQYKWTWLTDQWLELSVEIHFPKSVKLTVVKSLEIDEPIKGRKIARTFTYRYNVSDSKGNLFRYCSPHDTHNKFHHKHEFDLVTRRHVNGSPFLIASEKGIPHVSEVIEEILRKLQSAMWP